MLLKVLRQLDLPQATDLKAYSAYQLTILLFLINLPLLFAFPFWVSGIVLLSVGLKSYVIYRRFQISRWIILLIFILSVALIVSRFTVFGTALTGVVFLQMMACLKLLEAKTQRDAFLLMLVYFLLIMGGLMVNQSPLVFFHLFACLLFNLYIPIQAAQPDNIEWAWLGLAKSMGKIALVAMPFVLLLFYFFPRLEPLWKQPSLPRWQTGLSDQMSPSGLSTLAQNGDLAFRVAFAPGQQIPPMHQLYWRGPVLVNFDGKTWRRATFEQEATQNNQTKSIESLTVDPTSQVAYTVYHSGLTKNWVLPLDLPTTQPPQTQLLSGRELQSTAEITRPMAFELVSHWQYRLLGLSSQQYQQSTRLPTNRYPQARQLAQDLWHDSKQNPRAFIDRLLRYFNENPFYYDLTSPEGNEDIDRFLFTNRTGYCEHYSSAFAFMLRSVGLPARVVMGYQGGEINQISNQLEVKQLNAHAWVEAYLPKKGWLRFDPTAAVAPDRIRTGSPIGVAASEHLIDLRARLESHLDGYRWISDSLRALSGFWQNWIINYNQDKQNTLWRWLGFAAMPPMAWILSLFALVPVMSLLVFYYRRHRQSRSGDQIEQAMRPFIHYLRKQGMDYQATMPLLPFIQTTAAKQALGIVQPDAERVIKIYYQLRYGKADEVYLLKQAIHATLKKNRQ